MTARTRAQLGQSYQDGDIPGQSDYIDFFDSFLNLVDTTAQQINSSMTFAASADFQAPVSFSSFSVSAFSATGPASFTGTLSANNGIAVSGSASFSGNVNISGNLDASTASFQQVSAQRHIHTVDSSVKTVGTAQAVAKVLTAEMNLIVTASAGDHSFLVSARYPGRRYTAYNKTNVNLSLFPETGASINALSPDAAYTVSGGTGIIIDVITSTQLAVF